MKDAQIDPLVMTMFYSIGYLCTAIVAAVVMLSSGEPAHITTNGVLGGLIWGVGKLLSILAVTSQIGIAMGQAIQCCFNIATAFCTGIFTGEQVGVHQLAGIGILIIGLVVVVTPGMPCTKARRRCWKGSSLIQDAELGNDGRAETFVSTPANGIGMTLGVCLAAASGISMGVQALPFKLSDDNDSLSYAVGGALGQFAAILTACLGSRMLGLISGFRASDAVGLLPGLAGGGLLFTAAVCNTFAVQEIGLVGSCLGQLNMVVAGAWGILLFHEIVEWQLIVLFFLGTLTAVGGALLLELGHD